MASPQTENGFTRIANEIIDNLAKIQIPGRAMQLIWVIFRHTYGFHRDEVELSLDDFVNATGIGKKHLNKVIKQLENMCLITKYGDHGGYLYKFNKDWELWKLSPNMVIDQVITTYGDPDHHIRGSRSPHKGILITKYGDPTYKENFKDNSKDNFKDKPILTDVSFCGEIISIIGHLNQTLKSKGLPGRYLSTTKNYRSKIIARLKEGYTIEDFEQVHLVMANEWFGTKYQKHLTPDTLYRQSKFPKYINRPTHQQALSPEGHRSFQNLIKACEDE